MSNFNISFTVLSGENSIITVGETPSGEKFGVGRGNTLPAALANLKLMVSASMAELAEVGEYPMAVLTDSPSQYKEASFSVEELFPIVLRYLRTKSGLSQDDMSLRMNIDISEYRSYEGYGSNPTLATISKMEAVLNCEIFKWLNGDNRAA